MKIKINDLNFFMEDFGDQNKILRNRTIQNNGQKSKLYHRYQFEILHKFS